MKLGMFSLGQIVSIGISATVFLLALHYLGKRNVPLAAPLSRALR